MKRIVFVLALAAGLVGAPVSGAVLSASAAGTVSTISKNKTHCPDTLDYRGDYYSKRLADIQAEPLYSDNIVMLGNSITERGHWTTLLNNDKVRNFGIGGDCVAGMRARAGFIREAHPKAVFLMAGVNDLTWSSITPEELAKKYEGLLDDLGNTRIYIQSCLPVDEKICQRHFGSNRTGNFHGSSLRIMKFNALLKAIAVKRGLTYIDLWSLLKKEKSNDVQSGYTIDGVHLTPEAYEVWVAALKPYLADLKADKVVLNNNSLDRDWAQYNVFGKKNEQIGKRPDVVIMGDSITELWARYHPQWFIDYNYLGRGISGQTTSQMLCRFRQDVIDLNPRMVLILAGTNDLARNNGYISLPHIMENIISMVELAKLHGIVPVLSSVLPVAEYSWRKEVTDASRLVTDLNRMIRDYADIEGIVYIDFEPVVGDGKGGMNPGICHDGVHPLPEGYLLMEAAVSPVLENMLGRPSVLD